MFVHAWWYIHTYAHDIFMDAEKVYCNEYRHKIRRKIFNGYTCRSRMTHWVGSPPSKGMCMLFAQFYSRATLVVLTPFPNVRQILARDAAAYEFQRSRRQSCRAQIRERTGSCAGSGMLPSRYVAWKIHVHPCMYPPCTELPLVNEASWRSTYAAWRSMYAAWRSMYAVCILFIYCVLQSRAAHHCTDGIFVIIFATSRYLCDVSIFIKLHIFIQSQM